MYIVADRRLGETVTSILTNCSSVCAGIPEARFDKQPPDLQRVLTQSFKDPKEWLRNLDSDRCLALAAIFYRLCRYGLWGHVRSILKIDAAEPPVIQADRVYQVPGRTASVYFMSSSGDSLINALKATGKFCTASGIGASQHPGQTTLREISESFSLHISVGPDNQFDAHIDRYSPVTEHTGSISCSNIPTREALTHIGRELFPEKFRKYTGIPGVQVFPDFKLTPDVPRPEPTTRQDADLPPPFVSLTMRGPVSRPRKPTPAQRPATVLPVDVVTRIDRAIKEQVSREALLPSHVKVRLARARKALEFAGPNEETALRKARDLAVSEAESYPDPHLFALDLAERMERARRANLTYTQLNLSQYGGGDFSSRKAIAGEIRRIALILRNYLPDKGGKVRSIVIMFGTGNVATRAEVKLD